jgi:hypothetical protein
MYKCCMRQYRGRKMSQSDTFQPLTPRLADNSRCRSYRRYRCMLFGRHHPAAFPLYSQERILLTVVVARRQTHSMLFQLDTHQDTTLKTETYRSVRRYNNLLRLHSAHSSLHMDGKSIQKGLWFQVGKLTHTGRYGGICLRRSLYKCLCLDHR